ncbi:putative protein N(5)-glutamine methyltransferase [Heyndrickxia acidicola]|uniref:peptide chain release factor N(5)-glutamine methyltransferase n=1 Tax=Heyndrickxia acidicola TaxID=209389 RepID=A0ABU6MQ71_9BACI|nr:putative protein N(5)-glutamine methyltransferase [Heyndrickxia acidicola]MED1205783.1 putative protein N(5)-glutamine methyltransferase [Heyndrickxia acidicola]
MFEATVNVLRTAGCVFAEEEAGLLLSEADSLERLTEMIEKRKAGLPIEHIIGWTEFCGYRIEVNPGVFVPRRRTEFLALQAVKIASPGDVLVDMCCGTGAVAAVLAKKLEAIDIYAVDIDPRAVSNAMINLTAGHVLEGDLFESLPAELLGRVNVIAANAPYVPTERMAVLPAEARLHEPLIALDGGQEGLDIQRRVVKEALPWLAEGGHLLMETSMKQAKKTEEIFSLFGLAPKKILSKELDVTVVIGQKTGG